MDLGTGARGQPLMHCGPPQTPVGRSCVCRFLCHPRGCLSVSRHHSISAQYFGISISATLAPALTLRQEKNPQSPRYSPTTSSTPLQVIRDEYKAISAFPPETQISLRYAQSSCLGTSLSNQTFPFNPAHGPFPHTEAQSLVQSDVDHTRGSRATRGWEEIKWIVEGEAMEH